MPSDKSLGSIVGSFMSHIPISVLWVMLVAVASGAWYVSAQDTRLGAVETKQDALSERVKLEEAKVVANDRSVAVLKEKINGIEQGVKDVKGDLTEIKDILRQPSRNDPKQ